MDTTTKMLIFTIIILIAVTLPMLFVNASIKSDIDENYELMIDIQEQVTHIESKIDTCDRRIIMLRNEIDDLNQEIKEISRVDIFEKQSESIESNFIELKDVPSNMFCAMDYRKITNTASDQYKIQQKCVNNEYGIRMYDRYHMVALGSYFTRDLGDTYHVTLENGYEFDIMLGDYKDDGSTPCYGHPCVNYDGKSCMNVIEFIIDDQAVPIEVMNAGTFSILEEFGGLNGDGGNIKSMEYTGHVDIL